MTATIIQFALGLAIGASVYGFIRMELKRRRQDLEIMGFVVSHLDNLIKRVSALEAKLEDKTQGRRNERI